MSELRLKSTGTIKLFENDNTSNITIASPASLGADRTITLPDGDVTLSSGTMPVLTGSTNNTVATVTGANALIGEAKLTFDGTTLINVQDAGAASEIKSSAGTVFTKIIADDASGFSAIDYSHDLRFKDAGTETMRITSGAELCIGRTTASQSAKISVENTADTPTLNVEGVHATQSTKVFKVYSARNTSGGSHNLAEFENGAATKCLIQDGGNVENTNNSYGAISDERIKKDITDANSQWEDIKSVKVKNFKLKEDDSYTHLGVIAQELETANMNGLVHEQKPTVENIVADSSFGEIEDDIDRPIKWLNGEALPEGISVNDNKLDSDGNIQYHKKVKTIDAKVKSVKYSILYMKAIKALQESMERIETLEAKVTALENK